MMALSCNQAGLLAWMFLLLSLSEVQSECPTPVLPPHSTLRTGEAPADTYSTGTVLRLQCSLGFEYIPGTIPRMTCLDTSKWSELPTLCLGKRCPFPRIENGQILSANDLRLGEEVTFACDYGFRIIGGSTFRCVIKSGNVDWNRELPFCEHGRDPNEEEHFDKKNFIKKSHAGAGQQIFVRTIAPGNKSIPCARPPIIANGRYDPNPSDIYEVGWTVIYRCDADYSLIGQSTIVCIVAENGVDGKWNRPSPECKKVKCHRPSIQNGRVTSVFQPTYTYQSKLPIECNPGYTLVGSSLIECDADSQWKPSVPSCDNLTDPTSALPPNPPEEDKSEEKSLEDRLDIIEKKLDLILHILQLTGHRKTIY